MYINVNYDPATVGKLSQTMQNQIHAAVEAARDYYDHVFTNPITFSITIKWAPIVTSSGDMYSEQAFNNWSQSVSVSYGQVSNTYQNFIKDSADQITAGVTLPANDPTVSSTLPKGGTFYLSSAQAQAWGFASTSDTNAGTITLNSNDTWTFDPNNRAVAGAFDATGVIEHEISEIMGRAASLGKEQGNNVWTPLDLFRYTGANQHQLTPGPGWFSIDGGKTLLKQYNDPGSKGGGDAGDWLHVQDGGTMGDAFGDATTANLDKPSGYVGALTNIDLREMNVIGWNRAPHTVDDFNGDGVSDILLRNQSTGDTGFFNLQGEYVDAQGYKQVPWTDIGNMGLPGSYSVVGTGDFLDRINDTHVSDLVVYNASNRDFGYYHLNDDRIKHGFHDFGQAPTGYTIAAIGNFNGDGSSDILFRNSANGDIRFCATSAGSNGGWTDLGTAPTGYSVAGVGDFTRDGKDEILFRNNGTGSMGYWELDPINHPMWHQIGGDPLPSKDWNVAGIGDFDGDGVKDILFSSTSVYPGYLDVGCYDIGHGAGQWHELGIVSTSAMTVAAVGDYLGNGTSDVLLYNNSNSDMGYYAIKNFALDVSPFTNSAWHDIGTSNLSYKVVSNQVTGGV